jgi:hypothetical protein
LLADFLGKPMSIPKQFDFTIYQGASLQLPVRWESDTIEYRAISAISKSAPVVITSTGHGIPNGWWVTVTSVKGMTQINTRNNPPRDADYQQATVVDSNTIALNKVNSLEYNAYTSGGAVQFNAPVDLTGYSARMMIRRKLKDTEIIETLTSTDVRLPATGIDIDTDDKVITIKMAAGLTDDLTFGTAVYDLEMVSSSGEVFRILQGTITLSREVTR